MLFDVLLDVLLGDGRFCPTPFADFAMRACQPTRWRGQFTHLAQASSTMESSDADRPTTTDLPITDLARRMRQGDKWACEQLVARVYERLMTLARKMLRSGSPVVQRWEQTEDVAHAAWIRIQRALEDDSLHLRDDIHFFRIAARHVRFELIDLYRKHSGVQGLATNHQTVFGLGSRLNGDGQKTGVSDAERFPTDLASDAQQLMAWGEFHQLVEELSESDKLIVDLLWYQGLTQQQAAELIDVDIKTVKRRWRAIKLILAQQLDGSLIGNN